jgi:hypothetical protein
MSITRKITVICLFSLFTAFAWSADADESEVLALADRALQRITVEDFVGLTDLMIDSAVAYATSVRDGDYRVRPRSYKEQRQAVIDADFVERGFAPSVLVSGTVAVVWYPYDFYRDGDWSHCGVDVFNMVRTNDGWRIANMTWSAEQPPACEPHPDGPPPSSEK